MTNKATKAYMVEFGSAMLLYTVVVLVSGVLLRRFPDSPWRYPLALAPVIPAGFALLAFIRALGRMDELQRRIQFDAIVFASGTTAMLTFAYGFLEGVGLPHISVLFVLPLLVALWGIGLVFATRKYQ